jgi:FkbM family methyltransferase
MSYLEPIFLENIDKSAVQTIFELGSRDLLDAHKLQDYYGCSIYSFECNPDCLEICDSVIETFNNDHIVLVKKAVSIIDGPVSFYPFDLAKYDNMGASSLLKINFENREEGDPDYKQPSPQTEIVVDGIRLDTFMGKNDIQCVDMLCIDLQGYELNAIQSMGSRLDTVKYIITECSVESTYTGGATFTQLKNHLEETGFKYVCSNRFGYELPDTGLHGYSEFDALFIRDLQQGSHK